MTNEIIICILGFFIATYIIFRIFKFENKLLNICFIIIYILFLYFVLFNRSLLDNKTFSDGSYIKKWKDLIFKNSIVFINIIGNILIFIPLGIILKTKTIKSMILALLIIITLETIQYTTRTGVFDIVDIVLNLIGTTIGIYINNEKRYHHE